MTDLLRFHFALVQTAPTTNWQTTNTRPQSLHAQTASENTSSLFLPHTHSFDTRAFAPTICRDTNEIRSRLPLLPLPFPAFAGFASNVPGSVSYLPTQTPDKACPNRCLPAQAPGTCILLLRSPLLCLARRTKYRLPADCPANTHLPRQYVLAAPGLDVCL